jgi:hypothetical protein
LGKYSSPFYSYLFSHHSLHLASFRDNR